MEELPHLIIDLAYILIIAGITCDFAVIDLEGDICE